MSKKWQLGNWEFELDNGTKQIIINCNDIQNNVHWVILPDGIDFKNKTININKAKVVYDAANNEENIDLSEKHIDETNNKRLEVLNNFAQAAGFVISSKETKSR